jgi:hypothetical protein
MTNRREFLQIGIAATALPLASRVALSATPAGTATATTTPVSLYKAIYDPRFPESVAYGHQMEAQGIATQAIAKGDMTDFWYTELDPLWRKSPLAIAGLTAHGPLFCFEQLAWQHGMRVVFRAEHQVRTDASIEHTLSGPDTMLRGATGLGETRDWAVKMAKLAATCPTGRSALSTASFRGRADAPAAVDADPLISWVIAPAVKA